MRDSSFLHAFVLTLLAGLAMGVGEGLRTGSQAASERSSHGIRNGGPTFGLILASVAGIMTYISLDELHPSAREFGESHPAICSLDQGHPRR